MYNFFGEKNGMDVKAMNKRVIELSNTVDLLASDVELLRRRYETYLSADRVERANAGRLEKKENSADLERFISDLVTDPAKANTTISDLQKNPAVLTLVKGFLLKK